METTRPEQVQQFLRELSLHVLQPVHLVIGGAVALILPGFLSRQTEDVDVVNEVPDALRAQHHLLATLATRYHLALTPFQSHDLPAGWQQRLHSQAPLGRLYVSLVDVYDIFLSKLFSARLKDRDDLRLLAPQLDKALIAARLCDTAQRLLAAPGLRAHAAENWYIVYGAPLP